MVFVVPAVVPVVVLVGDTGEHDLHPLDFERRLLAEAEDQAVATEVEGLGDAFGHSPALAALLRGDSHQVVEGGAGVVAVELIDVEVPGLGGGIDVLVAGPGVEAGGLRQVGAVNVVHPLVEGDVGLRARGRGHGDDDAFHALGVHRSPP